MRRVLELVYQSWIIFPEVRLGQLLTNAASVVNQDVFYIDDYQLEVALKEFTDQTLAFKQKQQS